MLSAIAKSLFGPAPAEMEPDERRKHPRHIVVLDGWIYPIDFFSDVLIRNVSASGFMGEADVELTVGETLHLTLDDKAFQTGTVRWTEGQTFGVAFESPLTGSDATEDRTDAGADETHQRRAKRTTLNIPARLNLGRPPLPVTVENLSQFGMLLRTDAVLPPRQHLLVKLGDRSPVAAIVKWCSDDHIGVETPEPLGILSLMYANS